MIALLSDNSSKNVTIRECLILTTRQDSGECEQHGFSRRLSCALKTPCVWDIMRSLTTTIIDYMIHIDFISGVILLLDTGKLRARG